MKYRCISLEEKKMYAWAYDFEIGKEYDFIESSSVGTINLKNGKYFYWVDAECFELVEDSVDVENTYEIGTDGLYIPYTLIGAALIAGSIMFFIWHFIIK